MTMFINLTRSIDLPHAAFVLIGLAIFAAPGFVSPANAQLRASAQTPQREADMRALVVDLAAELRLVYRHNVPEYTLRHEQLGDAIEAWNASSKSAANRERMTTWLREAIRNSMPGSSKPLPPLPTLDAQPEASATGPRSIVVEKPIADKSTVAPPVERPAAQLPSLPNRNETPIATPAATDEATAPADDGLDWADHPAAGDLPRELDGDPFGDDPTVATPQL